MGKMPFFERESVKIYFEDVGSGEPIIANHGLAEDTTYWSDTGITANLAEKYRVISMDMRAHGRSVVESEPYGYDADTMGNDFGALADYLEIDKFHMLTHATGGMAGVRYAMTNSDRLISLILTDTGSATRPDFYLQPDRPQLTEEQIKALREWSLNASIEERIAAAKANPGEFLFKMAEHPNNEGMWKVLEGFMRRQNQKSIQNFRDVFYDDPDPRVEGLRKIKCPTLVLLGEFDIVFLKPSEIMAKEIPDVRHVIMPGIGHMTAIEAPEETAKEILDFLETVKQTGKANR
jgi:pimeloyl-ACP methyl ester carboxylesterase